MTLNKDSRSAGSSNDDIWDSDSIVDVDGRWTPASAKSMALQRHGCKISFRSVDDEEVQHVVRSLVTPAPSALSCRSEEDVSVNNNKSGGRHYRRSIMKTDSSGDDSSSQASDSSKVRRAKGEMRSESVMLFEKLNRGSICLFILL